MDIGKEICEYVKINPRVEKKPLVKKICPPIEEELLEGMQLIIILYRFVATQFVSVAS